MPTFDVDIGKQTYEVDAPDERTAWAWANQTHQNDEQEKKKAEKEWKKFLFGKNQDMVHLTDKHYNRVRNMVRQETTQLARIYHRDWYNNLVSTEHAEELDEIHSELNIA